MCVCESEELTGGTGAISRGRLGDTTCEEGGKRTRSCGLAAPGNVMSFRLPRCDTSLGLLGLTPGGYPPTWARASLPLARRIAIAKPIAFITRLIRAPDITPDGLPPVTDIGRQVRRHNS